MKKLWFAALMTAFACAQTAIAVEPIEDTLEQPIKADFKDIQLVDVLSFLGEISGKNFVFDWGIVPIEFRYNSGRWDRRTEYRHAYRLARVEYEGTCRGLFHELIARCNLIVIEASDCYFVTNRARRHTFDFSFPKLCPTSQLEVMLRRPISLKATDAPLAGLLGHIARVHNVDVRLDSNAGIGHLNVAEVGLTNASLHTALKVLAQLTNTEYVCSNEAIVFTSPWRLAQPRFMKKIEDDASRRKFQDVGDLGPQWKPEAETNRFCGTMDLVRRLPENK